MTRSKQRIIGIDVARALAIFGMILVNFKVVFGEEGPTWIKSLASVFDGKAAATFVVLAGVGLALMTNSALFQKDKAKLKVVRIKIAKRALFLFLLGLSYVSIWPADILHFYGVYMAIIILFLTYQEKTILILAVSLIIAFPVLMTFINYETAWDFQTLDYQGLWTLEGFLRNLFFNGFHPVIPWTAFMLFGYWFGKQDLHNDSFLKKTFWRSTTFFIFIQVFSSLYISISAAENPQSILALTELFGTKPMPPLPIYMLNGTVFSFALISACILVAKRFEKSIIIDALNKTGQLALTLYVAHVIIGMGIIEVLNPSKMGNYSIAFSVAYAIVFSLLCIFFAVIWRKYKKAGPLEWVLRKITG
jgi:uncharacterized membrane protein YeiB